MNCSNIVCAMEGHVLYVCGTCNAPQPSDPVPVDVFVRQHIAISLYSENGVIEMDKARLYQKYLNTKRWFAGANWNRRWMNVELRLCQRRRQSVISRRGIKKEDNSLWRNHQFVAKDTDVFNSCFHEVKTLLQCWINKEDINTIPKPIINPVDGTGERCFTWILMRALYRHQPHQLWTIWNFHQPSSWRKAKWRRNYCDHTAV